MEKKEKGITSGILPYRIKKGKIEVFIGHPGGPFHKGDDNKWSILKGQNEEGEDPFVTAIREFEEESGYKLPEDKSLYEYLRFVEKPRKNIHVWSIQFPDLDPEKSHSNKIPLTKKDGSVIIIPEIDKYAWVTGKIAKKWLNKPQDQFIDRLKKFLGQPSDT